MNRLAALTAQIIHAGFGFSGINLSYQVKTHMTNVELVCYEKNHKATGTWCVAPQLAH